LDQRWLSHYRIVDFGAEVERAIKLSIFDGRPVGVGLQIDEGYEQWAGGPAWQLKGIPIGGHMTTGVAYDAHGVWCWSAWPGSGDNQMVHVAWPMIQSLDAGPFIVADIDLETMPK
jgi:hypothetical protein